MNPSFLEEAARLSKGQMEESAVEELIHSSNRWHMMNALALIGDNGRDKLR